MILTVITLLCFFKRTTALKFTSSVIGSRNGRKIHLDSIKEFVEYNKNIIIIISTYKTVFYIVDRFSIFVLDANDAFNLGHLCLV